ncbi:MAG: potassium transporter TrkG [Pseudomonadota bacterium]
MQHLLLRLPLFVSILGIASLGMLIPALHALALDLHRTGQPFLYASILFCVLTALLGLATWTVTSARPARDQLVTLLACFLGLPVVLAVPFREALPDASFFNVYFEMVSSITTTGASVFDTPDRLSPPLHLWRGLVAWFGGFVILVAAAAILAPMNLGGFEVLRPRGAPVNQAGFDQSMQSTDPKERLIRVAGRILPIYAVTTAGLWLLLVLSGVAPFEALMLAFSTLSTSGIVPGRPADPLNTGVLAELLIFVFLFVAVSRQTLQNDLNRAFFPRLMDDREMRLALVFVTILPVALFLRHWIGAFEISEEGDLAQGIQALWGGIFTVLSFLSTTGFVSGDWAAARDWSALPTPGLVLAGLAIMGGGVATTAGGVKLLRVYALYKHGVREMSRLVHPSSIGTAGRLGRELRREGALLAWIFFMLFAVSIAGVMVLLAAAGLSFDESLVFAVASLSTTGPLAGIVLDGSLSFAPLSVAAKTIICGAMVLGRLETLAIVALFNPDFWRR